MRAEDIKKMKKTVKLLRCLAHPLRLSLLCYLMDGKEHSAGEMVEREKRNASQSQTSQYLGQLRRLGLVKTRRDGQIIYYRLISPEVKKLMKLLYKLYVKGS